MYYSTAHSTHLDHKSTNPQHIVTSLKGERVRDKDLILSVSRKHHLQPQLHQTIQNDHDQKPVYYANHINGQ